MQSLTKNSGPCVTPESAEQSLLRLVQSGLLGTVGGLYILLFLLTCSLAQGLGITEIDRSGVIYEVTLTVKRSGSRASRGDAWMRSVW